MDQVHTRFSDEQLGSVLRQYSEGLIRRVRVQEVLGIRNPRFLSLRRQYRQDPDGFRVRYRRPGPTRRLAAVLYGPWHFALRLYTCDELTSMLVEAGFTAVEAYLLDAENQIGCGMKE
jgi:hypothetical protein